MSQANSNRRATKNSSYSQIICLDRNSIYIALIPYLFSDQKLTYNAQILVIPLLKISKESQRWDGKRLQTQGLKLKEKFF